MMVSRFQFFTALIILESYYSPAFAGKRKGVAPVPIAQSPPEYSCPEGFVQEGKQCSKLIHIPTAPVCPVGVLEGDQCVDFEPAQKVCPVGFELGGPIGCSKLIAAPFELVCPPGFILDNSAELSKKHKVAAGESCSRQVPVPLTFFCPPETAPQGHECVSHVNVEPFFSCPKGYELENDRCITVSEYDCSPNAPVETFGPLGQRPYNGLALRLLGQKKKFFSEVPSYSKNIPPTKENYIVAQVCRKVERIAPLKNCPPGAALHGKECLLANLVPMLPSCPGLGTVDNCFDVEIAPPQHVCRPGFEAAPPSKHHHHHGADTCFATEQAPIQLLCQEGFQLLGDRCVIYSPPELICEGHQGHKHKHQGNIGNDKCSFLEYAEPIARYSVSFECYGKDCAGGEGHLY